MSRIFRLAANRANVVDGVSRRGRVLGSRCRPMADRVGRCRAGWEPRAGGGTNTYRGCLGAAYTVSLSGFIDLSHQVVEGMETYRPLPTPQVEILNDYDASRYA